MLKTILVSIQFLVRQEMSFLAKKSSLKSGPKRIKTHKEALKSFSAESATPNP